MRSFVCNYFSCGYHIPPAPHHLPMVMAGGGGSFRLGQFQPFIFSKETAVSVGLCSQQGKANNTKEVGQRALRKMEGFKIILEGREGLGGAGGGKGRKEKAGDSSDSPVLTCGRALLM